jgi:putative endonuclease
MSDPRHALGSAAEDAVAQWLQRHGWTVIGRRIRSSSGGEVDILALDPGHALVALEVRARRDDRTGSAAASLDARRVGRLERTLVHHAPSVPHRGLRVDLVSVEAIPGVAGQWRVRRLQGVGGA